MADSKHGRHDRQMDTDAVSRGILSTGSLVANYYTSEPSPGQWVAIGTVMFWSVQRVDGFPRWLLVGTGRTEKMAVSDLRTRMNAASPPRWRIKCEPSQPLPREHHSAVATEKPAEFVVPWEIGLTEATALTEQTVLDATLS